MRLTKPCPNCNKPHGKSMWRVLNSTAVTPLECESCGTNFHQSGARWWLVAPILLTPFAPSGTNWIAWSLLLVISALSLLSILLIWCYPLKAGPKFG
jgi:hypothetical protein